jgi:hypothetical protein
MIWEPKGKELPPDFLGPLAVERVLFEYEGPRSFTARDPAGELLFAHQCGEADEFWRYAVVPFSDQLLKALEEGRVDLVSALGQPRFWLVDIGQGGVPIRCFSSSLESVPAACRPRDGVTLYDEQLASENATATITERGVISELDREEQTCLLRDDNGITLHKIAYNDALFEEVKEAFDSQRPVEIAAQPVPPFTLARLLAIEFSTTSTADN